MSITFQKGDADLTTLLTNPDYAVPYEKITDHFVTPTAVNLHFNIDDAKALRKQILKPIEDKLNLPLKQLPLPNSLDLVATLNQPVTVAKADEKPDSNHNHNYEQIKANLTEKFNDKRPFAKRDRELLTHQVVQYSDKVKFIYDRVLGVIDLAAWMKRSDRPLEFLLKSRDLIDICLDPFLLAKLKTDYLPVILTSYQDYCFNFFPDISRAIQQGQSRPISDHPVFSQLVLFSRQQNDPKHLTYYCTLPINYQESTAKDLIDTYDEYVFDHRLNDLKIPVYQVKQTTIEDLNDHARQLLAPIHITNRDTGQINNPINAQCVVYEANDTANLYSQFYNRFYNQLNYNFNEYLNNYQKVLTQSISEYEIKKRIVTHYTTNLCQLSAVLSKFIDYRINDNLDIEPNFTFNNDFWQDHLKNLPIIRFNRDFNVLADIFLKPADASWSYNEQLRDRFIDYYEFKLNCNVDDTDLALTPVEQQYIYTNNLIRESLTTTPSLYRELRQRVLAEFTSPLNQPINQSSELDLTDPTKTSVFTPISKPQHNLSHLFETLIPSTDNHQMYLVDSSLVDPAGFSQIETLTITDFTNAYPTA